MVTHDDEIIERYPSRRLKISDGALQDCDGDTNVWAMESSAIICWWCQHYNETISWIILFFFIIFVHNFDFMLYITTLMLVFLLLFNGTQFKITAIL